jgi:SAM-dependent methyltransferase
MELFMQEIRPTAETTVVDVGVTDTGYGEDAYGTHNFFEALYPWPEQITAVSTQHLDRFSAAFPDVQAVRGDGRLLPFGDGEFDVGFSNAVVEHVGDRNGQQAFVHELCRVATRVFLATPNRWFPLEVHTLLPAVHWLPAPLPERIYRAVRREAGLGVELLGPKGLLALFPSDRQPRLVRTGMSLVVVCP